MPDEETRHDSGWLFKSIQNARQMSGEAAAPQSEVPGGWRDPAAHQTSGTGHAPLDKPQSPKGK